MIMSFKNFLKEVEEKSNIGIVLDIEKETIDNNNFRKVLFTGNYSQLVLMSINSDEDIGEEVHKNVDQFFRIDGGSGKLIMADKEYDIKDGSAFVVPAGIKHNIIAGEKGLKLYSVYSPPNHPDGTIDKTKEDAKKREMESESVEESEQNDNIRNTLIDFFKNNKNPDDSKIHALADKLKMNSHKLETYIYALLSDYINSEE